MTYLWGLVILATCRDATRCAEMFLALFRDGSKCDRH